MLRNRILKQIRLGDQGVNLWDPLPIFNEGEAAMTQNAYWRHGLTMKHGSSHHSANQVVAGKPIVGLHRFYYDTGKVLLATCGTVTKKLHDSTGVWTDLGAPAATDGTPTFFTTWAAVNKCYVANGVQAPYVVNSSEAYVALGAAPATSKMFVPYRDRLISIDATNPSYLRWSGSYDDTTWTSTAQAVRVPGSGALQAIALHALEQTDTGVNAMVLAAKPTSLYLFYGTNLDPASGTFDARLDPIGGGESVGCDAPRSIVSTPRGTFFLGNDNMVYLLRYGTTQLDPVGHNITQQDPAGGWADGLESLTIALRPKACAAYHDGFYKLSFSTNGTYNNVQYWLDVSRMTVSQTGHVVPWYGPMLGMNISMFALLNGAGDTYTLLGGEANPTEATDDESMAAIDGQRRMMTMMPILLRKRPMQWDGGLWGTFTT